LKNKGSCKWTETSFSAWKKEFGENPFFMLFKIQTQFMAERRFFVTKSGERKKTSNIYSSFFL